LIDCAKPIAFLFTLFRGIGIERWRSIRFVVNYSSAIEDVPALCLFLVLITGTVCCKGRRSLKFLIDNKDNTIE